MQEAALVCELAACREVREMADLDELFGPEAWGPIQDQLRRGEDPKISEMALALRGSQEIPYDVRCYIADLLEKKIKRKPGRKPDKSDRKKVRDSWVRSEVSHWIEVCKRAKRCGMTTKGTPSEVAIEKVSKKTGIPESTLDNIYYPRQKLKKKTST